MTPSPLAPGPDGSPAPDGCTVIRMANQPDLAQLSPEFLRQIETGKALPTFFALSSEDKKQPVPRLSVWVEGLTTVPQAWVLVGSNPKRRWVLFLPVDGVRTVHAAAVDRFPSTPHLEVQWERATTPAEDGTRLEDLRPGWEGHAGIANLDRGNKTQGLSLRWQLASLARSLVLSEEDLAGLTASPPAAPSGS